MPLDRRDVEKALQQKGFDPSSGDHSFFAFYTMSGKKTSVWTKTSRGSGHKTLGDNLVSAMAKQCGLTKGQFLQLIDCPLSREELERILIESGRIKPSI